MKVKRKKGEYEVTMSDDNEKDVLDSLNFLKQHFDGKFENITHELQKMNASYIQHEKQLHSLDNRMGRVEGDLKEHMVRSLRAETMIDDSRKFYEMMLARQRDDNDKLLNAVISNSSNNTKMNTKVWLTIIGSVSAIAAAIGVLAKLLL